MDLILVAQDRGMAGVGDMHDGHSRVLLQAAQGASH